MRQAESPAAGSLAAAAPELILRAMTELCYNEPRSVERTDDGVNISRIMIDTYLGKKRESAAEETFCASSFLIGAYSHTDREGGVLKCWIIDKPPSKRASEPTIVISG